MLSLSLFKGRSPPAEAQGSLPRKRGELGPGGSQGDAGTLLQSELGCHPCRLSSAFTSPGARTGHSQAETAAPQHVRGKQFIFLPQLLMGGKYKMSLGSSADELFTAMGETHNGRNELPERQALEDMLTKAEQFSETKVKVRSGESLQGLLLKNKHHHHHS